MTRRWLTVCLLICAWLAAPGAAFALKIAPFKATVTPNVSQVFRLENNTDEEAAVQVGVTSWEVTPDGVETNHDAEENFVIFPPQIILAPHESRAVRVQWQGPADVPLEQAYRLIAEQLPVKLKETPGSGSGVKFMLRFKAALYVASNPVQSHVVVTAMRMIVPGRLAITLHNDGTGHTLLQNPILHLKYADGRGQDLSGAALKGMDGENIHAGASRIFTVPFSPASGPVASATIDYTPGF